MPLNIYTFVKVLRGSRYKLVIWLCFLTLLNILGGLLLVQAYKMQFAATEYYLELCIIKTLGLAMRDPPFNIAHQMLATQYNKISEEVPKLLK